MAHDDDDRNFDRMHTVQALLSDVQNDMMTCLHRCYVSDVMQDRMLHRLQAAHDEIEKMNAGC